MIKKLLKLIQEALNKMFEKENINEALNINSTIISEPLTNAIEKWRQMYKDESPWLDEKNGVYSLGLAKQICREIQQQVLSEIDTRIVEPGLEDEVEQDKNIDINSTRATYLNEIYTRRLLNKLPETVEKALALGGMIVKPYFSNNQIYFDYCYQGEFYPIKFDEDGNIIDIAFYDTFIAGGYVYTKIERQEFDYTTNTITVVNKAYKAKQKSKDDETEQDLGNEIQLTDVPQWAGLEDEVTINNVEKPLYGYFKIPTANNIDLKSPLGVSIFSPATKLIQRADEQFSRLDWEYKGGQLAIDVDPTAVTYSETYFKTGIEMDDCQRRLYRKLDLGSDETYNAWAPNLRDANYINGLNAYKCLIEDAIGISRGTISDPAYDAKTATEIKLSKQRSYITISAIQDALEKAIMDVVYSMNVLVDLYNLAPAGDYDTIVEWKDSILTDTDTELNQKLLLEKEGILSKAEVRAWYNGESLKTAQVEIDKMEKANQSKMLNDIYGNLPSATLENNGEDDETSEEKQAKQEEEE